MPKRLQIRTLTKEEQEELKRLLKSRNAPIKLVQRARVIQALLDDPGLGAAKAGRLAGYENDASGLHWVRRFNEEGLVGLEDRPRPGRPPTHSEEVRSKLLDLALQKPRTLGYPFELWTLLRLQTSFEEREGVHLSDSTIWEWLRAEGLDWKRQQSWFHNAASHDPDFAEKRGR